MNIHEVKKSNGVTRRYLVHMWCALVPTWTANIPEVSSYCIDITRQYDILMGFAVEHEASASTRVIRRGHSKGRP